MKKKISFFALLLSLLVALVPPSSARADEIGVYNESVGEILSTISDDMLALMDEFHYVIGSDGTRIHILLYNLGSVPVAVQSRNDSGCEQLQGVTSNNVYARGTDYWYDGSQWQGGSTGGVSIFTVNFTGILYASSLNNFYDKDWNLIADDVPTYSEFMGLDGYRFSQWCADAGLNCQASSNESASVIPYSYNDYWHVVRKTSSGKWLLTTIGSTIGQAKMSLRLSEDLGSMKLYDFSGDDSFVISVREYEYDSDGWKLRSYDTYDYDDFSSGLLTLPAGFGIDDTRILAYTSTDIYSSDGLSVYAAASTEYVEPSAPEVTPEPTPGSGSSGSGDSDDTGSDGTGSSGGGRPGSGTRPSVGGEASGGGGLDFIINLFTLIWTKICAVPMSVDGYSISLQQLFVYGALVSIVGGFIMKFVFRR